MAIQKTEVIVLKTLPFRTSSLIVTFYSRHFGKLRGLVKGVRKENEMRAVLFELFTRLEIIFYEKTRSDLHLVSEASMLESFESLRSALEPITYASYFCELTDQLTEVHDPDESLFDLLQFCLRYLPSLSPKKLARLFEIKLLHAIGLLPQLESCLTCPPQASVPLERGFFSARQGSLFCGKCAGKFPEAVALNREPLAVMRYYHRHSLEESVKLSASARAEAELESLMQRILMEHLGKPLKSRTFLEKIKPALV